MNSTMTVLLLVLVVSVFVISATIIFLRKVIKPEGAPSGPWPFYAKKVLSQTEIIFFWQLVEAMPDCVVLARVPLNQLIDVKNGVYKRERRWWLKKINFKSVDFVVCRHADFSIVAAVDLDERPHARSRTKSRVLGDAGVPLIRWHSEKIPDVVAMRAAFAKYAQKMQ